MPLAAVRIWPSAESATTTVSPAGAGAAVVATGGAVAGGAVAGGAVAGGAVGGGVPSWSAASACSKAAIVAASTTPVGSTPSAVWKSFNAAVSSSVQTPSIGPVQKPVRVRIVCSCTTCMDCAVATSAN